MAVTVGDRIQSVITHMEKGEIELALSDVCIALDITAQKYYNETKSSAKVYKRFLAEHMDVILATTNPSIVSKSIKLPFTHPDIYSDKDGYSTLEQIIYHVVRCGLVHGTGESNKIIWNNQIMLFVSQEGELYLPPTLIWGLAICVIACPVNSDQHVMDTAWVSAASFKYLINDLWGKIGSVKLMIKSFYNVDL